MIYDFQRKYEEHGGRDKTLWYLLSAAALSFIAREQTVLKQRYSALGLSVWKVRPHATSCTRDVLPEFSIQKWCSIRFLSSRNVDLKDSVKD